MTTRGGERTTRGRSTSYDEAMTTRESGETRPRRAETTMEGEGGCAATATRTTNAQGVHTVSIALKTLPKGVANARGGTFHWGVMREKTGKTWQVLPSELHPPNTEYYKGDKAMRSAFPVWGPVNLVLDPQAKSVAFALYVEKTGEWINAVGGGNFEIDLAAETPSTAVEAAASAVIAAVHGMEAMLREMDKMNRGKGLNRKDLLNEHPRLDEAKEA